MEEKKSLWYFLFISEEEFTRGSMSIDYSQPLCHISHPEIKKRNGFQFNEATNLINKMILYSRSLAPG